MAQGSNLGPDLWNVSYDCLLRMKMPEETCLVGYADDVAARDTGLAQLRLNQVMRAVNEWITQHGLSLALENHWKTEVVVLTKKRIATSLPMQIGEEVVQTRPSTKYLGIVIDTKMNFGEHIRRMADKATKVASALSRLMANTSGPKSSKRRLLMTTVQLMLLYGAEVWADAVQKEVYRARLARVQRRSALRTACAYRTVSEPAILIIAGVIPIALLAKQRRAVYCTKIELGKKTARKMARDRTSDAWQTSWEQETRGRWTARLIKYARPWTERKHGEIDYYLTQFLSGHGYFQQYLKRMGKAQTLECPYCPGKQDNAAHTFFTCPKWTQKRSELEAVIGTLEPETIVEDMLRGEETWNRVARYVQDVLREKKGDLDDANHTRDPAVN